MTTTTRTYMVTVELAGEEPASFDREITAYLTSPDGPFAEDFGPNAWGGYDGPRAVRVSVSVHDTPAVVASSPLLDQLLHDVFVTAIEGGIGYWSSLSSYRWSLDGEVDDLTGFRAVIHDDAEDPSASSAPIVIDRDVILLGYQRALEMRREWNCEPLPYPHQLTDEGWECDAEDADVIVQLGVFGEVRYG